MRHPCRFALALCAFADPIAFRHFAIAQMCHVPARVTFTVEQDRQNMMDQLGIKTMRPGPNGDESAPNHANYDEYKANPFPNLPDRWC